MSNITSQLNDAFLAAVGFESVFGSMQFDSMDECEAVFLMGCEL